jgi:DNA-binding NarL/FixJ family response regulator
MSLPLTPRETQVKALLDDGRGSYQIARELGLADRTVQEYRRLIAAKLAYPTAPEEIAADKQRLEQAAALATKYRQDAEDKLLGRHW